MLRTIMGVAAALAVMAMPAAAQTYTIYSSGVDSEYSGTFDLSMALPLGLESAGFWDHLKGDKAYVEESLGREVWGGLFAVYELQDTPQGEAKHLVGLGYRHSVVGVDIAGKVFPYSSASGDRVAGEVSARRGVGDWQMVGFVDVAQDEADELRFFSKSHARYSVGPMADIVIEYRWHREFAHADRAIWFGLSVTP